MVLRATVGMPQICSSPPFHMWRRNCFVLFLFCFIIGLERICTKWFLVQPIISLVSSPRWPPLNSALNLECYNQEGQVTPEAKTMTRSDVYSHPITSVVFRTRV